MQCPQCATTNAPDTLYCSACGMFLPAPAAKQPTQTSGTSKPDGTAYAERKPVTLMHTGIDFISPAGAPAFRERAQVLEHCHRLLCDAVIRYGGMVGKIEAEAALYTFGMPAAHENHAQRACFAAIAARDAMAAYGKQVKKEHGLALAAAAGLHSGMMVIDSADNDDMHAHVRQLQALAKPGSIVISGSTHKLVSEFFVCAPLEQGRTGRTARIDDAFELVKATGIETRLEASIARGLTQFAGRDREVAVLAEAFAQVRAGAGQVVNIAGEAGIGKSRLVLELRRMLPAHEYQYLEGRCLTMGASTPYHPLLDILRSYLGGKEGEHEAALHLSLKKKLAPLGDAGARLLPPLQDLLSLSITDESYQMLSPPQKRNAAFEAIKELLQGASRLKPLVLVIEDLHWIDQISREFLAWFIPSVGSAAILLLQLYRPEYVQPPPDVLFYRNILLEQLPEQAGLELLRTLLGGGEVEPGVRELVYSRAGGNPLFVEELTRTLVEAGAIIRRGHAFGLAENTQGSGVPDTIQGIIASRIDRLDSVLKRILQAASVTGREFQLPILQAVTGLDARTLKTGLVNLSGLEFISPTRLYPEPAYMFKHALIQEASYNSLAPAKRQELHEKTGRAIEQLYAERLGEFYELLAYHYTHSANTEKALVYLAHANQKALQACAMELAKSCFDQAMAFLDRLPDTAENRLRRITLLVPQMHVFAMLVKMSEYYELLGAYLPLAESCDDPGLMAAYYVRLAACEGWHGYFEQDIKTRTMALELCEAVNTSVDLAWVYHGFLWCYLYLGESEKVLEIEARSLQAANNPFSLPFLYVNFLTCAAMANWQLGRWDEAIHRGRQALRAAETCPDDSQIATAAYGIGSAYLFQGNLELATEYLELAVSKARTPLDAAVSQGFYALAQCRKGEPQKGLDALRGFVDTSRLQSYIIGVLYGELWLGEGYLCAGNTAQARQVLEELVALARRFKAQYILGSALRLLGEAKLATDPAKAQEHFEESIALLRKIKAENEYALAIAGCGRYYLHAGDTAKGREQLETALAVFERLGTLREPDRLRRELTQLESAGKIVS